jgi:hypothetical protein
VFVNTAAANRDPDRLDITRDGAPAAQDDNEYGNR